MISSVYNPSKVTPIMRWTRASNTGKEELQKLVMVHHYNKSMGGIDLTDQSRSYVADIANRSRRGYQALFYFCLQQSIINARVLHLNYHMGKKMTISTFMDKLIIGMDKEIRGLAIVEPGTLDSLESVAGASELLLDESDMPLRFQHSRDHFPKRSQDPAAYNNRCTYCSLWKGVWSQTNIQCRECRVFLCVDDCFYHYHTDPREAGEARMDLEEDENDNEELEDV